MVIREGSSSVRCLGPITERSRPGATHLLRGRSQGASLGRAVAGASCGGGRRQPPALVAMSTMGQRKARLGPFVCLAPWFEGVALHTTPITCFPPPLAEKTRAGAFLRESFLCAQGPDVRDNYWLKRVSLRVSENRGEGGA